MYHEKEAFYLKSDYDRETLFFPLIFLIVSDVKIRRVNKLSNGEGCNNREQKGRVKQQATNLVQAPEKRGRIRFTV